MIENLLEKNKKSDAMTYAPVIFVILLVIILVIFRTCFMYTRVDGESMMNTLTDRQFVILQRIGYTPRRGDIVTINREKITGDKEPLIKRIIATEGDRLLFMYDENSRFLNLYICASGENRFTLCNEPYIAEKMIMDTYSYCFIPLKNIPDISEIELDGDDARLNTIEKCQITVPDGQFYFMGDNRNNSQDSRGKKYGTIDCTEIIGKVIKIVDMSSIGDKFLNFLSNISLNTAIIGEQTL